MEKICWNCCGAKKIITGPNDNTMLGLYVECPWCVTLPLAEEKKKQEKIESLRCKWCARNGSHCSICHGSGYELKEALDYLLEKVK